MLKLTGLETLLISAISRVVALAFAMISCGLPLRAGVVFTNFQAPTTGGFIAVVADCAAAFTPSANYVMTDAQVKVDGSFGSNFLLDLFSDNNGLPGTNLGTLGNGAAPVGSFGIVTMNSPAFNLVSGTQYWLFLTGGVNWAGSGSPSAPGAINTGTGFAPAPNSFQFQIDGNLATPEPTAFALIVTGLIAGFIKRRGGAPRNNRNC